MQENRFRERGLGLCPCLPPCCHRKHKTCHGCRLQFASMASIRVSCHYPGILITEWIRLKRATGSHLVQPHCSSRVPQTMFTEDCVQMTLNISMEGDSMTSPGNLCQCLVTCTVKFLLMFKWGFLCISFCPLPVGISCI